LGERLSGRRLMKGRSVNRPQRKTSGDRSNPAYCLDFYEISHRDSSGISETPAEADIDERQPR